MPAARPDEKNPTEAVRAANRQRSEDAIQSAHTTAEAGERAARAGADMLGRNADIMHKAWEMSGTMAAQLAQQSADQVARALGVSGEEARKAAEQSSANVEAVIGSSAVIAESLQSISREWMELGRSIFEGNIARCNEKSRCREQKDVE